MPVTPQEELGYKSQRKQHSCTETNRSPIESGNKSKQYDGHRDGNEQSRRGEQISGSRIYPRYELVGPNEETQNSESHRTVEDQLISK